jgi:hypothetical protein
MKFDQVFKQINVYKADYGKFEKYVGYILGRPFDIVADQELSNDMVYSTDAHESTDKYGEGKVKEFMETGKGMYLTPDIMDYLCINGHIPPGKYYILVSW